MDIVQVILGFAIGGMGVKTASVGVSSLRKWYQLGRTDTISIHDAALEHGAAEVTGTVEPIEGDGIVAPLTGKRCVVYEYAIERRKNDRWTPVSQGEERQPFLLTDGRETAYVEPDGASLTLERERIEDVDRESLPDDIKSSRPGRRRYIERRLDVGSTGLVHGDSEQSSKQFADVQFTGGENAGMFLVGDSGASTLGRRHLFKGVTLTPLGGFAAFGGVLFILTGLLPA